MKTKRHSDNESSDNHYEKIIEEARKSLRELGDIDFLNDIPDDSNYKIPKVVFPYGSKPARKYTSKNYSFRLPDLEKSSASD